MLGSVAFPAMIVVFFLAEPLLRLWVGRSLEKPEELLPQAEILVKIMVFGLACRAVSDGWMKLFYGAGHIRKYAPYVFAGGLFNPILCVLFIFLLPEDIRYTGAAIAYSSVFLIFHMILMPKSAADCVGLKFGEILRPTLRPLLISIAISPTLLVVYLFSDTVIDWVGVIVGVCSYGVAYAAASWCFMLTRQERKGVQRLLRRVIGY